RCVAVSLQETGKREGPFSRNAGVLAITRRADASAESDPARLFSVAPHNDDPVGIAGKTLTGIIYTFMGIGHPSQSLLQVQLATVMRDLALHWKRQYQVAEGLVVTVPGALVPQMLCNSVMWLEALLDQCLTHL